MLARKNKNEDGWVNLLEGKDLAEHWTSKSKWIVDDDGVLGLPRGDKNNFKQFAEVLWSKQQYKDFEIESSNIEGNETGGPPCFLFHVADPSNPLEKGMSGKPWTKAGQTAGGGVVNRNAAKPRGEWSQVRVTVQGNNVTVEFNSKAIVQASTSA